MNSNRTLITNKTVAEIVKASGTIRAGMIDTLTTTWPGADSVFFFHHIPHGVLPFVSLG